MARVVQLSSVRLTTGGGRSGRRDRASYSGGTYLLILAVHHNVDNEVEVA